MSLSGLMHNRKSLTFQNFLLPQLVHSLRLWISEESDVNTRETSAINHLSSKLLFGFLQSVKIIAIFIFRISEEEYVKAIKGEISKVVKLQEELDIDVLVHGEPEVRIEALFSRHYFLNTCYPSSSSSV